jgi:hypothetical protein
MCISSDMFEEYADTVGWTRDERQVCGAVGRYDSLSLRDRYFHVSYNFLLHCILKLRDGGTRGWLRFRCYVSYHHELSLRFSNLALLLI